VPWSENGDTAMFVTLFGGKNGWRLGLFPVDAIVESQVESSHQRRADKEGAHESTTLSRHACYPCLL